MDASGADMPVVDRSLLQLGDASRLLGHLGLQLGDAVGAACRLRLGLVLGEALLLRLDGPLLVTDDPRVVLEEWKIVSAVE